MKFLGIDIGEFDGWDETGDQASIQLYDVKLNQVGQEIFNLPENVSGLCLNFIEGIILAYDSSENEIESKINWELIAKIKIEEQSNAKNPL